MVGFLASLPALLKVFLFFIGLWKEKDEEKSKKKAEIGTEIVNAFKETDKKTRASRLNTAVGHINRV